MGILGKKLSIALLAAGLAWSVPAPGIFAAGVRPKVATESDEVQIPALIRQLGDEQYAVRQEAQEELARLGPAAFDALVLAQDNDDIEIASRAKYLVHQIRIEWVHDSDSPQVKEWLKDYDTAGDEVRLGAIDRLAEAKQEVGLEPLCRLIRFEKSPLLSKKAALLVLDQLQPDATAWEKRAKVILDSLAGSTRPAARWLRAYVLFRTDPENSLNEWDKLIEEELATVEPDSPEDEMQIITGLMQRDVKMLTERKHPERATAMMRKMIARESGDVYSLVALVDWLVEQKAWEMVDEVAKRFDRTFAADPNLLYTLAQARKIQGNDKLAEDFARQAFDLNGKLDDLEERRTVAERLEFRGMIAWAEREYRFVIDHGPAESDEVVKSRLLLSELLHDQEREADAADVLQGLIEVLKGDGALKQKVSQLGHAEGSIRARYHYFKSCNLLAKKDVAGQTAQLDQAIMFDPDDSDVLIALYHLPNQDNDRRQRTHDQIQNATQKMAEEIKDFVDNPQLDPMQLKSVAETYNQYAWLVGNTDGDLDQAVRYAQKAVEMEPTSGGILDTLAHCYAGKKDFANAVATQTRALELEPHSLQIRRALEQFRTALEESKKKLK